MPAPGGRDVPWTARRTDPSQQGGEFALRHRPPETGFTSRMKILLACRSFRLEYGGPAYSVSMLAASLAVIGQDVALWAPEQPDPSSAAHRIANVRLLAGPLKQVLSDWGRPDVIHDNGIWLAHNHMLARLATDQCIPRVVSSRGMLAPWAMRHKPWRKRIAWHLFQRRDLESAAALHATSAEEAQNLAAFRLGPPVFAAPNGIDLPRLDETTNRPDAAERIAVCLGRLYPVKGIPNLVRAWAAVRTAGWRLRIIGPDEAGHRAEIERLIESEELGNVVSISGPVRGADKQAALTQADLFILPSLSESFGIVVAEALAHGLPVLTTTATPWNGLADRRCGWSVAPTVEGLVGGLRAATAVEPAELRAMGRRGRAWMEQDFSWERLSRKFADHYEAIARRA